MAGNQVDAKGLPANIAGMSKNQLYEIMSQMKKLIEQNQQQAKQILIQNPLLTKALFQAQIMLGMVKPPQMTPTIQPPAPQQSQQSSQPPHQPNIQPSLSLPGQAGLQEQAAPSQNQPPLRKQQQNQVGMQTSVASVAAANLQSQPMPPYSLQTLQQTKGHLNPPLSLPHTSEPPLPLNSSSQLPHRHQTPMLTSSSQMQQSLQTTGVPHMPLHPPMQPQARLPLVPNFNHQYAPQMGPKVGFQHPCPPQHLSQLMFNSGNKPPSSHGPLFPQGQPPHANQMPPQSTYQNQAGGLHLGSDFGSRVGGTMQTDRGTSRMLSQPDNSIATQLQGPSLLVPGQMGLGNQPPRPASLTPEMEKALLQQVMSLTPEQINLLPPEQRNQVLQLQQVLRQ
ncbi:arginine-glutamic acid dipeptide repeats protein-like [Hibiscus syriacus]|uniref:arginine-glutamic acid dipeptide repeats protein-like n=1 Tax=Hibiscus syriacus TaxID=106335 RepID=UPI0019230381|nr:arginine-glutamic acid dipeptide repeats protein-like [Hibiscus syriacus]